ncbi:hypothetical protein BCR35DRAFT_325408 [Leucosporidium creatinivorum]|uniref:F-box domain-containing protein n=1 Tax=Leucosporidium creatinivorum TaxID=106004 RepID=A0A1Y2F4K8_9BASI|nr:hypothetical protein BCR35DRAFT_325408 [Leucosporidium creatinivorum]
MGDSIQSDVPMHAVLSFRLIRLNSPAFAPSELRTRADPPFVQPPTSAAPSQGLLVHREPINLFKSIAEHPFPPTFAMAPTLPTELISRIVQQAGGPSHQRDDETLSQLCLVDKSFLPFARDELYSLVFLRFRQLVGHEKWGTRGTMVMIGGYDDESSGEEDKEASATNDQLRRTLREAPHLATLVRRIILHIRGQDWHKDLMEHASEALVDLFTNCKGANSLVLHCAQSDLGLDLAASNLAKAGLGTQLVDLSAPMSGSGLLELLTKLPHLRRMVLNLDYLNKEDKDAMGRYTFPFSLKVLYLSDIPPPKFLAALTANSSSSLRHLHIEYCDDSLPSLSHITALETLSLSFGNMLPYPPSPDALSTFLAAQPSLHTLHLGERNTGFLDKAFLLRLPSTLTFLDLEKSTALPADVITYISQPAERRAKNIGLPLGDAQPRSQNKKLKMMRQACREKVSSLLRAQSRGRRGMRSRSLDALDSTQLGLGMDSLFFNEARRVSGSQRGRF